MKKFSLFCLFLLSLTAQRVKAKYTLECEQSLYNVSEGQSVRVCLRFVGDLSMTGRSDADPLMLAASVKTEGLTANGTDFTDVDMSFSLEYSPNMRGLVTLPCVEITAHSDSVREGVEGVRVVIVQSKPMDAVSNCTVRIYDRRMVDVGGTHPPQCEGTPQPQASVSGAIAGAVVGGLFVGAGVTVVIVMVAYFLCYHRCKDFNHTNPEADKSNLPRPVVYKKNGDTNSNLSASDSSTRLDAQTTPTKNSVPQPVPIDNPNYVNEEYGSVSDEAAPTSPIYGNVEREDRLVASLTEPELYEIPVSSLTNQNADEVPQAYEVPLASRSNSDGSAVVPNINHDYHTLEPPVV